MSSSLPSSADEAALPPGLATEAAALVEPGEAPLWVGRGRSGATFAALWPGAAVILVLLALLLWLMLAFDGWTYRNASPQREPLIPADDAADLALGLFAAALSWKLVQFALRVAGAPRTLVVLTSRRFLLRAGRRSVQVQLADLSRAVVNGPRHRAALHFQIRKSAGAPGGLHPTLFGVVNADSAIEVLERLGVAVHDDRPKWAEEEEEGSRSLEPGESVRWSGRRGLAAIGPERLTTAALAAPLVIPFFVTLWIGWSGVSSFSSLGNGWSIFMTVIACLFFGPMAWLPLSRAGPFFREWIVDAFGTLAVTDRRILFIAPLSGAIEGEVPAEQLVSVAAVAFNSRGRGQISLTLKPESGEEHEHMELYSVPDPDNAVAAIGQLIRPE